MTTSAGPPGGGNEAGVADPGAAAPARRGPARGWYWVALAVFLAGAAWLVVGLVTLGGRVSSFQRVPIPGTGEVSLTHSGGYVIYYEGPGAAGGNPAWSLHVTPQSGSAAVQKITLYSGDLTYTFGSREGRAIANLQVAHPGRFLIEAAAQSAPAGSHLAVGPSIAGSIVGIAVPGAIVMTAAAGGAIAIAIIRRSRAKRDRLPMLAR